MAIAVWAPGALEPLREMLTTALHDGDAAAEPDSDAGAEPDDVASPTPMSRDDADDGARDADATAADAVPPGEVDVLHSPGTLAHWLTGLGLVGVRAETVQRHLDLTDEIAWSLVLGTELRDALHDLDDDAVAGVRERLLAALAATRRDPGRPHDADRRRPAPRLIPHSTATLMRNAHQCRSLERCSAA